MRVLVACEYSGVVRQAFMKLGHDVLSCDLLPSEDNSPYHYQGDIRDVIGQPWDLMIAHPPCTYLSVSGLHWNKRTPGRAEKTEEALQFVQMLLNAPIKHIALENPVSCISSRIRKPDQIIHPWMFGHDASKATCLWLKNLPALVIDQSQKVKGRIVGESKNGKTVVRWSNQTDSGQNKLGPSEDRWKERSRTFEGIGQAMAQQWSAHINKAKSLASQENSDLFDLTHIKNESLFATGGCKDLQP